jgi:hypothetical protein
MKCLLEQQRLAIRALVLSFAVWWITGLSAFAQKPPGLGYAYPPAVAVGKTTEIQLGGFDFTSDMQWFLHDERLQLKTNGIPGDFIDPPPPYWTGPRAAGSSLPIPREVPATITVPADMPEGLVRWQVANANGSSGTAMLYIGGRHEFSESRSRDLPQRLTGIPVAVSGRLSRLTEVDRYEITAQETGVISIDLMARRLGADFQAVLEVSAADGTPLADYSDTQGLDGSLSFAATAGESYTISIRDADFRGDRSYVYRLSVTTGPRILCNVPAYAQRGLTRDVTLIGYGLTDGSAQLQSLRRSLTFPTDDSSAQFTLPVEAAAGTAMMTIQSSAIQELTPGDAELTSISENTWKVTGPAAITASLNPEAENHRCCWPVVKDELWKISLQSRGIGGCLDVALSVVSPSGQIVRDVDDSGGTSDASFEFRAAESGDYCCIIRSITTRTGQPDEIYRLEILRSVEDFELTVPQQINIPSGGKTEITVQAVRSGGFSGEIAVSVNGLPPGLTPEGTWLIPAAASEIKVSLQAAADAAVTAGVLTFEGRAKTATGELSRAATAVAAGNLSPRTATDLRTSRVIAAMTMPAPFDVLIIDRDRQHEVSRGTTFLADVEVARKPIKEGDVPFAGAIRLETSAAQQRYRAGIRSTSIVVPADTTRSQFPCFMPEWLATDLTQRMLIHGVAQVPDPKGNLRELTKAGNARITMIMEGALLKLTAEVREPLTVPGDMLEIPVRILRSPTFQVPVTIQLHRDVLSDEVNRLFSAEPLLLDPKEDTGHLKIRVSSDKAVTGDWQLRLTATALQDGRWPVISETELPLEVRSLITAARPRP